MSFHISELYLIGTLKRISSMALYSWFELTNKNVAKQVVINKGMWPNACAANSEKAAALGKNRESLLTTKHKRSLLMKAPLINTALT